MRYTIFMPLDDIRKVKLDKLKKLREVGIEPYPAVSERTTSVADALADFDNLVLSKKSLTLAGRIMARRGYGGLVFFDINDSRGKIQCVAKEDILGAEVFKFFNDLIDIGDIIEVSGILFTTGKLEKSIQAQSIRLLTKALLPLPEKWHGLQDVEERYRKRYLDLIMNPAVKDVFVVRSKIVEAIREFLLERDYLEVQTPILQAIYGGGSARPFVSKLNALDMPIYMRIANELYLKRLVVGGMEKVFEFSVDFRNEGIDRSHNPEFMLFEAMTAYKDYVFGMQIIEDITEYVTKKITGGTKVMYQGTEIDYKKPWRRISMRDAIKEYAGIDIEEMDDNKLDAFLDKHKIELNGEYTRG